METQEKSFTQEKWIRDEAYMKAIVYEQYGPPEVLQMKEIAKPIPKADEVLIRVHAATVTTGDVNLRGFTFVPPGFGPMPRLMFGVTKPRKPILGTELAGEVVAIGKDVTLFKEGDQVFGIGSAILGAYAEYVCRSETEALVAKPVNLSYEEAAAVPFGAGTALYFLRDKGNIQHGDKILIIGASGGVGSYAVQLAKYFEAEVTGVCSTKNMEMVKSLGADKVIDYTNEDFTQNDETYDLIFDTVGKIPFSDLKSSLKKKGLYLAVAGGLRETLQMGWTSLVGRQKVIIGTPPERKEELFFLKELCEVGVIKPMIDRCYTLAETAVAHRYVDTGRKRGNVVITVPQNGRGD